jgi:hypothetical protein
MTALWGSGHRVLGASLNTPLGIPIGILNRTLILQHFFVVGGSNAFRISVPAAYDQAFTADPYFREGRAIAGEDHCVEVVRYREPKKPRIPWIKHHEVGTRALAQSPHGKSRCLRACAEGILEEGLRSGLDPMFRCSCDIPAVELEALAIFKQTELCGPLTGDLAV